VAFVPGDIVKAVLAAIVARGVHAAYPGLLVRRRSGRPGPA
jgi:biotin transport system substrate-specific component